MRRLVFLIAIWLVAPAAHADESQARDLFRAGVEAMLARDWAEAARLLEASLAHKDKPACRFNLVVAHRELKRPLEVARHALAFLALIDGRSQSEEAAEVRTFLDDALRELVTLQTEGLPLGAQPRIDGAPPRVVDGTRIYELPGLHRLELWVGERRLESIEIELGAGAVQPWPRVFAVGDHAAVVAGAVSAPATDPLPAAAAGAVDQSSPEARLRSRKRGLAWGLGLTGAASGLAAVASYGYVAHRARELRDSDTAEPGYTTAAARYQRLQRSVMPLALAGGALMASAAALVAHRPRAARAVAITALIAGFVATGVGAVLMIRTPETLIEGTTIEGPGREAGSLSLGAGLPLLSYGVRLQWGLPRASERR